MSAYRKPPPRPIRSSHEPRPSDPAGVVPARLRDRPSVRRALVAANGLDPWREQDSLIAQLGAIALGLAVIVSILLRGCA